MRTTRRLITLLTATTLSVVTLAPVASAGHQDAFSGPDHQYGEVVDFEMVFPVAGPARYSNSFWVARPQNRVHHGIDIMAAKMTPVVAIADGTITYVNGSTNPNWPGRRCCTLRVTHPGGWVSKYIHLNNDTPGTDDGQGWGLAPGIDYGVQVTAGQVIGYVGDSGNAEGTAPHLHFELMDKDGVIVNPYASLRAAQDPDYQVVTGVPATQQSACSAPNTGSLTTLLATSSLLKKGARGTAVSELQRFLTAVGIETGPIDGVLGAMTHGGIQAFQQWRGLNVDGVVGPNTLGQIAAVYQMVPSMPALSVNSRIIRPDYRGDDVKQIQTLLRIAGFDPGPSDGVYGPLTQAAVSAFQSTQSGLTVDGKVGPNTRAALRAQLGLTDHEVCG
jgi:peptidoglycan hydrolase-like protein with peptidoglycan-binding domain